MSACTAEVTVFLVRTRLEAWAAGTCVLTPCADCRVLTLSGYAVRSQFSGAGSQGAQQAEGEHSRTAVQSSRSLDEGLA